MTPSDASNPCASAPVAPDRRNSWREGIAVKPFSSSCHFTTTDRPAPVRTRAAEASRTHATARHTLTDTKTSESLDKLPGRKSIGHSRLFGGAREGPKKETERNGNGEERGVKDRIHHRLVPVLFALIAPRYNGTRRSTLSLPVNTCVRMSDASIISIWRASIRRKRETGSVCRSSTARERQTSTETPLSSFLPFSSPPLVLFTRYSPHARSL